MQQRSNAKANVQVLEEYKEDYDEEEDYQQHDIQQQYFDDNQYMGGAQHAQNFNNDIQNAYYDNDDMGNNDSFKEDSEEQYSFE